MQNTRATAIYVFSNPSYINLLKIGCTSSIENVEKRRKELFTTAVPTEFHTEYAAEVYDAYHVESALHQAFNNYRVHSSREFFFIKPKVVIDLIREMQKPAKYKNNSVPIKSNISAESFIPASVQPGSTINFKHNNKIIAEVIDQTGVIFNGNLMSLTCLSSQLTKSNEDPLQLWLFDNQLLSDINKGG